MGCPYDNLSIMERHLDQLEDELASRPDCAWCGDKIQDEFAYRTTDGLVCPNCMDESKVWL